MHDVTSYQDVPSVWRDRRGVPMISFGELPLAYHKFLESKHVYWLDGEQKVEACPNCQQPLDYK